MTFSVPEKYTFNMCLLLCNKHKLRRKLHVYFLKRKISMRIIGDRNIPPRKIPPGRFHPSCCGKVQPPGKHVGGNIPGGNIPGWNVPWGIFRRGVYLEPFNLLLFNNWLNLLLSRNRLTSRKWPCACPWRCGCTDSSHPPSGCTTDGRTGRPLARSHCSLFR